MTDTRRDACSGHRIHSEEVPGHGKESWVREVFTEVLAVLRMNRTLPGGGSMGSKDKGWRRCRSQKRMCAKYKDLKYHDVLSNYRYFSIVGWRTRGAIESQHLMGVSFLWLLGGQLMGRGLSETGDPPGSQDCINPGQRWGNLILGGSEEREGGRVRRC